MRFNYFDITFLFLIIFLVEYSCEFISVNLKNNSILLCSENIIRQIRLIIIGNGIILTDILKYYYKQIT